VFKILKGVDKVDPDQIFARRQVNQHTKHQSANPRNLTKKQAKTDPRLHSSGLRVVEELNALSDDIKSLEKIKTFKCHLRREREQ
jgi:hypothetical protein